MAEYRTPISLDCDSDDSETAIEPGYELPPRDVLIEEVHTPGDKTAAAGSVKRARAPAWSMPCLTIRIFFPERNLQVC